MKKGVRWAVMVGDEMYPGSLSLTREGAESYVRDARHTAPQRAAVRLVKVTIEPAKPQTKARA